MISFKDNKVWDFGRSICASTTRTGRVSDLPIDSKWVDRVYRCAGVESKDARFSWYGLLVARASYAQHRLNPGSGVAYDCVFICIWVTNKISGRLKQWGHGMFNFLRKHSQPIRGPLTLAMSIAGSKLLCPPLISVSFQDLPLLLGNWRCNVYNRSSLNPQIGWFHTNLTKNAGPLVPFVFAMPIYLGGL